MCRTRAPAGPTTSAATIRAMPATAAPLISDTMPQMTMATAMIHSREAMLPSFKTTAGRLAELSGGFARGAHEQLQTAVRLFESLAIEQLLFGDEFLCFTGRRR